MNVLAKELRSAPPTAWLGIIVIAALILVGFFAPLLAPYGEAAVVGKPFASWSSAFPLGTDNLGRDMLTRLIYGARNTIGIALVTTLIAFILGILGGLLAGTVRGWTDTLLSRLVDVLMAIPSLIFSLLLLTIFGTSALSMILIIAVIESTRVFRLSRALAMEIAVLDYVLMARLRGEGLGWIMLREILPNAAAPLLAEFGLRFCFVFLFISALSFLGLGVRPPTADWGSMVRDNATLITFGDITPLLPAAAIAILTLAVNFVVDWRLHRASGLKEAR